MAVKGEGFARGSGTNTAETCGLGSGMTRACPVPACTDNGALPDEETSPDARRVFCAGSIVFSGTSGGTPLWRTGPGEAENAGGADDAAGDAGAAAAGGPDGAGGDDSFIPAKTPPAANAMAVAAIPAWRSTCFDASVRRCPSGAKPQSRIAAAASLRVIPWLPSA